MKIHHILVPIRGLPLDAEQIHLACAVAKKEKGKVYVVYVIEVKRALPLEAEIELDIEKGEQALADAEVAAEEVGYEVEGELLQAREAGPAIVEEAIERKADLIILSLPYRVRFGDFYLGPTTMYVLKHAPCRVWICREEMPTEETP